MGIEKVGIENVKDREDDQSSPKVEENKDDICSDVENIEDKIMNEGYQIAEVNKKEKEIEKIEIESIKDKEDDQSSPKVEEKDDNICFEVENTKEEITTKEDQIAEIDKEEKKKEEVAIDIIKDKEDDQSRLKMEEKEDNI